MQKTSSNIGSILIWSIFFSMIISILFLGISTKINKKLRNSSDFLKEYETYDLITNKIKNEDFTNEKITNKTEIIFEANNSFSGTLQQKEKSEINFTNPGNINIRIISGGPINFKFGITPNYTSSGVITNIETITNTSSGTMILENMGGYTRFHIESDSSFIAPEKRYKVIEQIGNKQVEKTYGSIK